MLKTPIIHPTIMEALARSGHFMQVDIADRLDVYKKFRESKHVMRWRGGLSMTKSENLPRH